VRELEQRSAPTAEKDREIASESPRDRPRAENAFARVGNAARELRQ